MMEKDLNLKIDRNWLSDTASKAPQNETHGDPGNSTQESVDQHPSSGHTVAKEKSSDKKQPLLWLLTASHVVLAVVLVTLLISTGTTPEQPITPTIVKDTPISQESLAPVLEGQTSLKAEITHLQQQVEQLELQLYEQREQAATVQRDMEQFMALLHSTQTKEPTAPATNTKKTNSVLWSLNLGTFSSQEAATSLQKTVSKLGYQPTVARTNLKGKTAYRVQLPGFNSREAAEKVADLLMNKTNLNGLWATQQTIAQ